MTQYTIKSLDGSPIFTAEVPDDLAGRWHAKFAVEQAVKEGVSLERADLSWAVLSGADIRGANMRDANMRWAVLRRADLSGANMRDADLTGVSGIEDRIIDLGVRSDGHRFLLTRTEPGEWRIKAGCRNFTITEAFAHWNKTRPESDPLGDETRLLINSGLAIAKLRNWPEQGEEW